MKHKFETETAYHFTCWKCGYKWSEFWQEHWVIECPGCKEIAKGEESK